MAMSTSALQDVSRETSERLGRLADILCKWNSQINLVSASTLDDVWTRHIADSAQVFGMCPEAANDWIDLGSGGGFPGLVIAIMASDCRPHLRVTLVEADQRKASFLREAARLTGTTVTVLAQRVEALPPVHYDVVSARAFRPLDQLLGFGVTLIRVGGLMIFHKGRKVEAEIADARKKWDFTMERAPSLAGEEGSILKIWDVRHA